MKVVVLRKFTGFYDECKLKYGNVSPWRCCMEVFNCLPLAAVINERIFCVHGGLSPEITTVDQICRINRNRDIPHEGAFTDLMWSSPEETIESWAVSPRGAGWLFGKRVTNEFLYYNKFDLICRCQYILEGYKFHFDEKNVVTIFSVPNYCYTDGNVASIMKFDNELNYEFKIFNAAPENEEFLNSIRRTSANYFV